jgi:hypothetical protein
MKNTLLITLLFLAVLMGRDVAAQNFKQMVKLLEQDRENKSSSCRNTLDNFGWSVAVSGDYAVIGAVQEDEDADGANTLADAGAAYIFVRSGSTWSLQQKITPADRAPGDRFGHSVAISGSYVVVGAPWEDEDAAGLNPAAGAGSAYIFSRSGATWAQQQKLVAGDRASNDSFGYAVSLSGDFAIVGAPAEDEDASGLNTADAAGSAYIFARSGSAWIQQQKITAGDRDTANRFGYSVAISGDYAIAGAYNEEDDSAGLNALSAAGSAYIFYRNGNIWGQQEKLSASDRDADDHFGYAVAISGDYAMIGAYDEDEDANGMNTSGAAGSAYIFLRDDTVWNQQQKLVASDRAAGDHFGCSVSISGDYAIAGAYAEDATGISALGNAGSAYVFRRSGNAWTEQQKIVATDRASNDNFGWSVAIDGDYAIAGAFMEDEDASGLNLINGAGSAFIFDRNSTTWSQQQKVVAADRAVADQFGYSVAISGNYAIVGAPQEDENAAGDNPLSNAGAAYIFIRSGATWTFQQKIVASHRAIADFFGASVAISGDYAIVGAYMDDRDASGGNTASAAGSAYIFYRSGATWTQQQKILASDRSVGDLFGYAVSISGDYAVVGAYNEDEDAGGANYADAAGSAYIFSRNGASWTEQQKIVAADRGAGDHFGVSAAISGDYVIVGAGEEDEDAAGLNTATDAGSAYIFHRSGASWAQQQKLVAADRGSGDNFGAAVAICGDYAIIGAAGEDEDTGGLNTAAGAGSAYIFYRSGGGWAQQQKIVAADRAADDKFGASVAITGDEAMVGAPQEDEDAAGLNPAEAAGSAYIFSRAGSSWQQQQKIIAADRAAGDLFGSAVAMSGDYTIVSAFAEDDDALGARPLNEAGSAYIIEQVFPLPLKLLSFGAEKWEGGRNRISWRTTNDIPGSTFELERSGDGYAFTTVGSVIGNGSGLPYALYDERPLPAINYYRLKIIAPSGKTGLSGIAVLRTEGQAERVGIAPVPASGIITVTNGGPLNGSVATIISSQGRVIQRFVMNGRTTLDVTAWPAGIYTLRTADGQVLRIVKQ